MKAGNKVELDGSGINYGKELSLVHNSVLNEHCEILISSFSDYFKQVLQLNIINKNIYTYPN